jgi:putative component of membrane protein insertase Oxa1/YidC/SpoIIIJ protein YidD
VVAARFLLPLALLLFAAPLCAEEPNALDFLRDSLKEEEAGPRALKPTDWRQTNEVELAFTALLALYQGLLSTQDGAVCSFTPSCSQYAKLALKKYGPVLGVIIAADRLQRCNGWGSQYYPTDPLTGKLYDPLP